MVTDVLFSSLAKQVAAERLPLLALAQDAAASALQSNHLSAMLLQAGQSWALLGMALHGSTEQIASWTPTLTAGAKVATAIAEPHTGSDMQALGSRITREGDGDRLQGQKRNITLGAAARYLLCIVREAEGHALLLLDREVHAWQANASPSMIGMGELYCHDLVFTDYPIAPTARLAPQLPPLQVLGEVMTWGRGLIALGAAHCLGLQLRNAVRFVQQRESYGRTIAQQQYMQYRLTELQLNLTRLQLLGKETLKAYVDSHPDALALGNMAKIQTGLSLMEAAQHLLAIQGTEAYQAGPTGQFITEALAFQAVAGTEEVHRISLWRQMARNGGAVL